MARSKSATAPESGVSFEQAMSELEEIVHVLEDSQLPLEELVEKYERGAGLLRVCNIMTIGQYLQPHARRLPVERFVTPEDFERWREMGMEMGFKHVESSPLTRSSYHARQQAETEPQISADAHG